MRTLLPLCACALVLAQAVVGQTLLHEAEGSGASERIGQALAFGHYDGLRCLAIGAPHAQPSGVDSGQVKIRRDTSGFPLLRTLDGAAAGDEFGAAIATGGDLNGDGHHDFVVGAPGHFGGRGAVYFLSGVTGLSLVASYVPGSAVGDAFGTSVAVLDDVNGDGHADVVVGAPNYDTLTTGPIWVNAPNGGLVRVISGWNGSLIREHKGIQTDQHLGWSVAVLDDVDGDGVRDYAIGAPDRDSSGNLDVGWVQIYSGATGAPHGPALWGTQASERFGYSVAGAGDVNDDGIGDLIVGAPYADSSASPFGSVNAGRWSVHSGVDGSVLHSGGPGLLDSLSRTGFSVAGAGDVNNDSRDDFIVGAPGWSAGKGRAVVHSGLDGSALYILKGEGSEALGDTVAGNGYFYTIGGVDGYADFAVSRPFADGYGLGTIPNVGKVGVYSGRVIWNIVSDVYNFGKSVGVVPDADGDGWDDFIVSNTSLSAFPFAAPLWQLLSGRTSNVLHSGPPRICASHVAVSGLGDVNGDGRGDYVVGIPCDDDVEIRSGADGSLIHNVFLGVALGSDSGWAVAGMRDTDGDGVSDFIVGVPAQNGGQGWACRMSGATGLLIAGTSVGQVGEKQGWSVADAGDVDGDGLSDMIVGAPYAVVYHTGNASGRARVWSSQGNSLFAVWGDSAYAGHFGWSVAGIGDVNADGFDDVAIGEPDWNGARGRVHVRAGPDGWTQLYTIQGTNPGDQLGYSVSAAGDIDRDGHSDFAIGAPGYAPSTQSANTGKVWIYSGKTGSWLVESPGQLVGARYGTALAGRPEAGIDNRDELIAGLPDANGNGGGIRVAMNPGAIAYTTGTACGTGIFGAPQIHAGTPRIGEFFEIWVDHVDYNTPVTFFASLPPAGSSSYISLGGCLTVYLDLGSLSQFPALPALTPAGAGAGFKAALPVLMPVDVALAGFRVDFQAHVPDPLPPGFGLTSALRLRVGF